MVLNIKGRIAQHLKINLKHATRRETTKKNKNKEQNLGKMNMVKAEEESEQVLYIYSLQK